MFGVKIENMKEIGSITKCTDMGKQNGQMEESTKVSIKMTKSMEQAHFTGRMVGNISASGKTGSSMGEENITFKMERRELENGLKEKELNGFKKTKKIINKTKIIDCSLHN